MPRNNPKTTRNFALGVVQQLRSAGFEALWAGGCVRDELMGKLPKDYDVATNARPSDIQRVFGDRRTLNIGVAFGVVTILGPRDVQPVEVATFREDAAYSDGRHPDSVTFSNAREDALRRDFTINGLFYDPVEERVIDYVGGQDDIQQGVIRAIRDPYERIAEDKLRMLRAIRFAAALDFSIDSKTFEAVQSQAHEIVIVSAERVAAELRKMLEHERRVKAANLLLDAGLLDVILPESQPITQPESNVPEAASHQAWERTLSVLARLEAAEFPVALAALLVEIATHPESDAAVVQTICQRWRLSRHEVLTTTRLLQLHRTIRTAHELPWPRLQRILIADGVEPLVQFSQAVGEVYDGHSTGVDHCRRQLALPPEELNPPPLITGNDLRAAGYRPGPRFKSWLEQTRDAQLEGRIHSRDAALNMVRELAASSDTT